MKLTVTYNITDDEYIEDFKKAIKDGDHTWVLEMLAECERDIVEINDGDRRLTKG